MTWNVSLLAVWRRYLSYVGNNKSASRYVHLSAALAVWLTVNFIFLLNPIIHPIHTAKLVFIASFKLYRPMSDPQCIMPLLQRTCLADWVCYSLTASSYRCMLLMHDNWLISCDIVVLTGISAADNAAIDHAVSNLTDLHSDYNSLIRIIPALKQLLQSWNKETRIACEMYAIQRTVNVVNSFRLSRGN